MSFSANVSALVRPLDPVKHAEEIRRLERCRSLADLNSLADQWLTSAQTKKRLKLVKHGNGTFMVVQYEDGWSTRLSMQLFPGARR